MSTIEDPRSSVSTEHLGFDVVSHDRIEVRRTIAADPAAVWSAVTDITRSVVVESDLSFIPQSLRATSTAISGVDDREAHNQAGMAATLERLAAALEG